MEEASRTFASTPLPETYWKRSLCLLSSKYDKPITRTKYLQIRWEITLIFSTYVKRRKLPYKVRPRSVVIPLRKWNKQLTVEFGRTEEYV